MNPDYALKEESVHDKSWESNIRERFLQIEEENSKLPQNLSKSENHILKSSGKNGEGKFEKPRVDAGP